MSQLADDLKKLQEIESLKAQRDDLLGALDQALVVLDGALYYGHQLNANGEEKLQAVRNTFAKVRAERTPQPTDGAAVQR